jgi:hypothetical protein
MLKGVVRAQVRRKQTRSKRECRPLKNNLPELPRQLDWSLHLRYRFNGFSYLFNNTLGVQTSLSPHYSVLSWRVSEGIVHKPKGQKLSEPTSCPGKKWVLTLSIGIGEGVSV